MVVWEYRVKFVPFEDSRDESEDTLNQLGQDGWELVAVVPRVDKDGSWTLLYLKKAIQTAHKKYDEPMPMR